MLIGKNTEEQHSVYDRSSVPKGINPARRRHLSAFPCSLFVDHELSTLARIQTTRRAIERRDRLGVGARSRRASDNRQAATL